MFDCIIRASATNYAEIKMWLNKALILILERGERVENNKIKWIDDE